MSLVGFRARIVLLVVAAYVILNMGFMLLRIPPGGSFGVPAGELLVLVFILTFFFDMRRLPSFAAVAPLAPLLVWWGLGSVRMLIDFDRHGIWAFRDATHLIDSVFLWIGFLTFTAPGTLERFSGWLRTVLNAGALYALSFPFREALIALSPKVYAPAGYFAPIFFNYYSASLIPLTAAMSWLIDRVRPLGVPAVALAGGMIIYCIVIFQMRTTYLQVIALFIVLAMIRPSLMARMSLGIFMGMAGLALVLASGLEITGRLGEKFSVDFFVEHFAAIWGVEGKGAVRAAASGVSLRLAWWMQIWTDVTSDLGSTMFGLGYGIPLTGFRAANDSLVREPHNSIVSVFARLGFVGLFAFVWLHAGLVAVWFRAYRACQVSGETVWRNNLLIIAFFSILLWVLSIGEDAFEKPFNSIPYYFLWGVVLRAYYEMRMPFGRLCAVSPDAGGTPLDAAPAAARYSAG